MEYASIQRFTKGVIDSQERELHAQLKAATRELEGLIAEVGGGGADYGWVAGKLVGVHQSVAQAMRAAGTLGGAKQVLETAESLEGIGGQAG